MIDPLLTPPSGAPRHAARSQRRKRAEPARASKILTAGASATALFTMVAAMGWQSGTGSAKSADQTAPAQESTPTVESVLPGAAVAPSLAPAPSVEPQAATVPAAAVPVLTTQAPAATPTVVVPQAVAVATLPVQHTVKHKSHTTTKTSG